MLLWLNRINFLSLCTFWIVMAGAHNVKFLQKALQKQTRMRCQCFCLLQEMPRDISVIGYLENEVLFSLLPKTKIECLPSMCIFSFVYVVQTLARIAFCKSCGTSLCAVPWSYRGRESLPSHSPAVPLHPVAFTPNLPALPGQNTLLHHRIDGCQWLPLVLGNISPNESLWWNVYNVGTITNLQGETKQRGVINTSFVFWTHTLNSWVSDYPAIWPMVKRFSEAAAFVSDFVKGNTEF